jgi:hypothetical protein
MGDMYVTAMNDVYVTALCDLCYCHERRHKIFLFVRRVVEQPENFPYKLRLKKFKNNFTNRPACLGVCVEN